MHVPKVSVILPVYGVERTLAACLDSVLAQTEQNFEIICVNDASPDGSGEILWRYAVNDPRIQIVGHKTNRGLPAARNSGLACARGEYLLFADTDDKIHRQTLELTVRTAERYAADIVAFKAFPMTEADRDGADDSTYGAAEVSYVTDAPFEAMLNKRVNVFVWNKLYRRRVFGGDLRFNEQQRVSQDQGILPLLMLRARRLVQLKNRLYYYFNNPESLSNRVKPWTVTSHVLEGYLFAGYLERYPVRSACRRRFRRYTAKSVFQAVDIVFSRVPQGSADEARLLDLFVEECRKLLDSRTLALRDFSAGRALVLTVLLLSKDYALARQLWAWLRRAQNPFRRLPDPGREPQLLAPRLA